MKSILTTTLLLLVCSAFAQQQPVPPAPFKYKSPYLRKLPPGNYYDMRRSAPPQVRQTPAPPSGEITMTLPNGNKVYALPQDNMPCIVPDVQYTMPNGGNNKNKIIVPQSQPGAIPNPGSRISLIPVKQVEAPVKEGVEVTPQHQ